MAQKAKSTQPRLIRVADSGSASSASTSLNLKIEYVPLPELRTDGNNVRNHTVKQINQIKRSLENFGFITPIIADVDGAVVCGNGRLVAAGRLGLTHAPVVRIGHLTPAQVRAFQITDNKLCDNSTWDDRLLGEALRDLSLQGLDFDLTITGFEVGEIDLAIQNLDAISGVLADPDDEPPPRGPLITRLGDLWEVLGHRVFCGDALDSASYIALMGEERARMGFADPPYNVGIQGNAAGFGKIKYAEFAMASGEMSEAEFAVFLFTAFERAASACAPGALAYVCIDWRHVFELIAAARRAFCDLKNICIWAKDQAGQGSFYRSQHEMVVVFQVSPGKTQNNIQLGRFGRSRSNLWTYQSPSAFGRSGEEGRLTADHPTPKPVAMIADAILDCTARGDIVLDPFLGGGASLVAAERVGRRCRAIEIEPRFVDASLRRLRRLTGEEPRRISDGRLFGDLEREADSGGAW